MARRQRSPIQKARRAALAEAEASRPDTEDLKLDRSVQTLKVIEIKRRVIQQCSRKIPWAMVGTRVAAIPMAISVALISPIGIFIFGAVFSGALSQLVGPLGAMTKRSSTRQELPALIDTLQSEVKALSNARICVFGVLPSTKKGLVTGPSMHRLDAELVGNIDADGRLPIGDYVQLGIAFARTPGDPLVFEDQSIRRLDWVSYAREKQISDADMHRAISRILTA